MLIKAGEKNPRDHMSEKAINKTQRDSAVEAWLSKRRGGVNAMAGGATASAVGTRFDAPGVPPGGWPRQAATRSAPAEARGLGSYRAAPALFNVKLI